MKNVGAFVSLVFLVNLFLLSGVLAVSIDSEIQKITHYAEEYETGNINYIQLLLYSSAVKQSLNEIIGTGKSWGGAILKQEELRQVLGEPDEETNWIWVEEEESEKRFDEYIPVWRKIIFDGNKIQIRLNAWPNLRRGQDDVLYNLNLETMFKKPKEQLNIKEKAEKIKGLAEIFNSNPTSENGKALAKESVGAERIFEEYYRQSSEQCDDLMKGIFGSENQRKVEEMLVQKMNFYQGENFDVIARIEMCEECEWHWMNIDFWFEGRGGFRMPEGGAEINLENFKQMGVEEIKQSITRSLGELKQALENGDFKKFLSLKSELQMYNRAWDEKTNDVWKDVEKIVEPERKALEQRENTEKDWINFEKNKRKLVKERADNNYRERKQFYEDLFSDYDKKEFVFIQNSFEKRLVEEFKEFGEEICNNREDDNDDGAVDCRDNQCAGKICGSEKVEVVDNNATIEVVKDLYCINELCQLREDVGKEKWTVCGDHVCEGNETVENCVEDCILCPEYPPIECAGKVIFKGRDKNGCPLEPICMEEKEFCETDEDCVQPLCGIAKCVKGDWKEYKKERKVVKEIVEEDEEGEKVVEKFEEEKLIEEDRSLDSGEKEVVEEEQEEAGEKEAEEVVEKFEEEETEKESELEPELELEDSPITGNIIFSFFRTLVSKITGAVVSEDEFEKELSEELGKCRIIELEECRKEECTPGDERIKICESGDKIVADKCIEGLWRKTGAMCEAEPRLKPSECPQIPMSMWCPDETTLCPMKTDEQGCSDWDCNSCGTIIKEPVVGDECTVRDDCGGENDVCSNGKCVTIPLRKIEEPIVEPEEPIEEEEVEEQLEDEKVEEEQEQEQVVEEEQEEVVEEEESEESPVTGEVITGFQIDGDSGDGGTADGGADVEDEVEEGKDFIEDGKDFIERDKDFIEDRKEFVEGEFPEDKEFVEHEGKDKDRWEEEERGEKDRGERERENWEEQEGERREAECEDRCKNECYNKLIQPCVDFCIHNSGCFEKEGACDEELKVCKESCGAKGNEKKCVEECFGFCKKGEDPGRYLNEIKREELFKQEKGVFQMGGSCRTAQGKTEAFIWFDGWGEPFEQIQPLKQKYYSGGETDWWKDELENLKKQRKEFEKGFNEKFVAWFFEKYLVNSAEDWENHVSGIFDLYWTDVDISRQISEKMSWLDTKELLDYNLIDVKYDTDYGSLEFWEEIKTTNLPGMDEEVQIISPYMNVWIFPTKSFITYQMKEAMKNHEFPMKGPEEEDEQGISEEDRAMMRRDEGLMEEIREISEKYNGNLDAVIQFKDYETDEVVFNVYARINEKEIISIEPMLPEEVPAEDVRVEIDFEKIYDLIYTAEEMNGAQLESPPWDRKSRTGMIKGVTNKVKMYFKMRSVMKSMKFYPAESEDDMEFLVEFFIDSMGGGPGGPDEFDEEGVKMEEAPWQD